VTDLDSYPRDEGPYDTAICLNVIEHVKDDRAALLNIKTVMAPDGKAIVLVPQGQWNFGRLDEVLGHERRYSREQLRKLADDCGFEVREIPADPEPTRDPAMVQFNRIGTIAWFLACAAGCHRGPGAASARISRPPPD
jgi:SAM-dependent methyltransferase